MKTLIKTILSLQMTALLWTTAFAAPGGPARELPFHGSVEQVETQVINFPEMAVEGTGTGIASVLGRYNETFEHQVDLLTGEGIGFAQFTAANGDSILTELVGLGVPTEVPNSFLVTEHHNIVGGTGRFEGVTGSFTLVRRFVPDQLISRGSIDGTIVLKAQKHAKQVPFSGTIHADEVFNVQFPILNVVGSGTGTATHLGHFTVTYDFVVDLTTGVGTGAGHYIAANGDSLFTNTAGGGTPTENPDVSYIEGTNIITGGTGRFEGATGSFTHQLLLNLVTGVSIGSYNGSISLQKR